MRRRLFAVGMAALTTLSILPQSASAKPELSAPPAGIVGGQVSAAPPTTIYWTPERIRSARPVELFITGTPGTKPPVEPVGPGRGYPPSGEPGSTGGPSLMSAAVPRPYLSPPARLNGTVFFTKMYHGQPAGNFACSGTSVNSRGLSMVWTAGHCVHGGEGYDAHANWVFVPAYSSAFDGEEPYGQWHAKELWTRAEWAFNRDPSLDLGLAIVHKKNGVKLTKKIGGQGIWFGISSYQRFSAFGYPGQGDFDGFDQYRCDSVKVDSEDIGDGPNTIGITCDMTPGSSGGGWLINIGNPDWGHGPGWGLVNSVNSYKWPDDLSTMYGPYHGAEGLALYDFAANHSG